MSRRPGPGNSRPPPGRRPNWCRTSPCRGRRPARRNRSPPPTPPMIATRIRISSQQSIPRRRNACVASAAAAVDVADAPKKGAFAPPAAYHKGRNSRASNPISRNARSRRGPANGAKRDFTFRGVRLRATFSRPWRTYRERSHPSCVYGSRTRSPFSRRGRRARRRRRRNADRRMRRRGRRRTPVGRDVRRLASRRAARLVNAHHHFYQTLTRAHPTGFGKELIPWLVAMEHVWGRMTPEALRIAVRMALIESCFRLHDGGGPSQSVSAGPGRRHRHRSRGGDEARPAHDGDARIDGHFGEGRRTAA